MSLRPNQSAAAAWMKEHDLAFVNPKGKLVLNSSSLIFTTLLSRPEKVKDPVNPLDRSLWSLRRSLLGEGWLKADSGKHASVGMQKFNYKCEHHAYYAILLQRIHICLSSVWDFYAFYLLLLCVVRSALLIYYFYLLIFLTINMTEFFLQDCQLKNKNVCFTGCLQLVNLCSPKSETSY